ncbi:MAG: hypothetical protein KAH84_03190, partial [Thiomargarita sp.]|nr:hypothetical protein [Thiomargarita sp.]
LETKKLSLKVIVRLGYAHELSTIPDHKHLNRIVSLPTDESLMQAWLAFAANIYTTVAKYDNFLFGFISWEDFFWLELMHLPIDLELSNQIAKNIGFANYISNVKSTNFKSVIADNGKVLIPKVASTGAPLFIKYWDQWLLKLLKTSQTHFPCLTMEVRVDCEPGPPNQTYICHEDTFDLGGIKAPTVIYYSPAWGANNIGDHVSSDEAIARFSYLIDYVQKFTDNPIFVDQFNYIDNTPGFGLNTQIKPTEITEFLTKSIDVIRKQTIGYGLWTLWDVPANILPNSQFKFGKTGWNFKNASLIELPNSSNMWVYLRKDGYIERDSILNANSTGILMSKKEAYRIELLAYSFDKQIPKLGITVADNEQIIASPTFQQEKLWQFEITDLPISTGYESLSIQNMGNELLLKDIVLYNVVQSSGVMDVQKKPSFYYEEILRLNQQLTTKNPYYLDKTTYSNTLVTGLYNDFWASKL